MCKSVLAFFAVLGELIQSIVHRCLNFFIINFYLSRKRLMFDTNIANMTVRLQSCFTQACQFKVSKLWQSILRIKLVKMNVKIRSWICCCAWRADQIHFSFAQFESKFEVLNEFATVISQTDSLGRAVNFTNYFYGGYRINEKYVPFFLFDFFHSYLL